MNAQILSVDPFRNKKSMGLIASLRRVVAVFIGILLVSGFSSPLRATLLCVDMVHIPIYLQGSDMDVRISIHPIPYVLNCGATESRFSAIAIPFIPSGDGFWKQPHDLNLTSLYRIGVSAAYAPEPNGGVLKNLVVTIDASTAVRPEGYPFTIDQVIDAVATCVKLAYPSRPAGEGILTVKVVQPKNDQPGK